MQIWLKVLLLS